MRTTAPVGRPQRDRHPCDVCRRVHRGRCVPTEARTVNLCVTIPAYLARSLREQIPWGERSALITRFLERELS